MLSLPKARRTPQEFVGRGGGDIRLISLPYSFTVLVPPSLAHPRPRTSLTVPTNALDTIHTC